MSTPVIVNNACGQLCYYCGRKLYGETVIATVDGGATTLCRECYQTRYVKPDDDTFHSFMFGNDQKACIEYQQNLITLKFEILRTILIAYTPIIRVCFWLMHKTGYLKRNNVSYEQLLADFKEWKGSK